MIHFILRKSILLHIICRSKISDIKDNNKNVNIECKKEYILQT